MLHLTALIREFYEYGFSVYHVLKMLCHTGYKGMVVLQYEQVDVSSNVMPF